MVIASTSELHHNEIRPIQVNGIELIVINLAGTISVFDGRCPHQGSLLSEGVLDEGVLTCRTHGCRFSCISGRSLSNSTSGLKRFNSVITNDQVKVDLAEILAWHTERQPIDRYNVTAGTSSRSLEQLPGPKGIPIFGNALQLHPSRMHLVFESWRRQFGPIYKYRVMNRPAIAIAEPALISQVLRDRPETYRRWDGLETVVKEIGLDGIIFTEGDTWRRQRRIVSAAFRPERLRSFSPVLSAITGRLLKRWEKEAVNERSIDILNDLTQYAAEVITSFTFGAGMGTARSDGEAIHRHLEIVFPMINRRSIAPFPHWRYVKLPADRKLDRAMTSIRTLTAKLIASARSRLRQRAESDSHPTNVIEALLCAPERLTDDEVLANALSLLLAGEDTTANTISWIMYFLCRHPDVQMRLQSEVDSVAAAVGDADTLDAIDNLRYLDCVINETMRLKPVVPVSSFQPINDIQLGGISIPGGTMITLLTRDTSLYQDIGVDLHTFKPDRWLTGFNDVGNRRNFGFFPFGAGPRLCAGRNLALMEIKSVIVMLCRNFDVSLAKNECNVEETYGITMRPQGLHVRLRPRHK
ncbi:cytochrome P450 [Paraburkholderia kururiensis]|uniref:cytochrome P450 n=1 Tax=Paraburkholderia kururiensis TaxID=984307 RepID=UPI002D7F1567|nr:cytochrome P450 [Paraburkholderia kururiensis]